MITITPDRLRELCIAAVVGAGAGDQSARVLADATVGAEERGHAAVGVAHLFDYLDGFRTGRINIAPQPRVEVARSSALRVDADGGLAQLAFAQARSVLIDTTRASGIAFAAIGHSFTAGELAYFTASLADEGLIAIAGATAPALMGIYGSPSAVIGTNPLSFAVPGAAGTRVIDQASSTAAWVRVRDAAERREPIPAGWATDVSGTVTTDPRAALAGALLPFGGTKGSNVAVLIELLAALAGASFSIDAPGFDAGAASPDVAVWIIAIDPSAFRGDYVAGIDEYLARIAPLIGHDLGRRRGRRPGILLPDSVHERLVAAATGPVTP